MFYSMDIFRISSQVTLRELLHGGNVGGSSIYEFCNKEQIAQSASNAQSCLTLCDPIDCSPPGFSVHGILQARKLEWVIMPSSEGSSKFKDRTRASCIS